MDLDDAVFVVAVLLIGAAQALVVLFTRPRPRSVGDGLALLVPATGMVALVFVAWRTVTG